MPTNCYQEEGAWVREDADDEEHPVKKVEPKRYYDENGEREPEEDLFIGKFRVIMNTPMGQRPQDLDFMFPEEVSSVDEAFDMFGELADEELQKFNDMIEEERKKKQEQAQKQKLEQALPGNSGDVSQEDVASMLGRIAQDKASQDGPIVT